MKINDEELDEELELIRKRKMAELAREREKLEMGVCPVIPRDIVHIGSCEAFSKIFNSYPETPIVMYAWAEWCGPCHTVGPLFEKLVKKYSGKVFFLKANVDVCKDMMTQYKLMGVPSFVVFYHWKEVYRLTGSQPLAALENLIQQAIALAPK
ncbi:MAG TPA: thioredoxin family protein [Candidatus Lokiarchaeia archaeon]|nr:thioredoxin family protein [Candidatus Lokiarchaeia archaeon]